MVTKLEDWEKEQEICHLDHASKKRTEPQQECGRRIQKLRRQKRCIHLQKIVQAWRRASEYTRNNARKIKYARRPMIDLAKRLDMHERTKQRRENNPEEKDPIIQTA